MKYLQLVFKWRKQFKVFREFWDKPCTESNGFDNFLIIFINIVFFSLNLLKDWIKKQKRNLHPFPVTVNKTKLFCLVLYTIYERYSYHIQLFTYFGSRQRYMLIPLYFEQFYYIKMYCKESPSTGRSVLEFFCMPL